MRRRGLSADCGSWKHHLQAHGAARPGAFRAIGKVIAIEQNLSAGRLLEPDEELGNGALAAAALAHECDELILGDAEGRFLHRLELLRAAEQPAANAVVLLQLFDLQDDVGGRFRGYRRVFGGFNVRHTGGVNAGDVMVGRDRHIRRLGLAAFRGDQRTARREMTSGHAFELAQTRHLVGHHVERRRSSRSDGLASCKQRV